MKHIYRIFFQALFTLVAYSASAQYEYILKPQEKSEISTFRKNKVMGELQKYIDNGTPKTYRARAFDTSGRVLADLKYERKQYYLYNNSGAVTAYLDSVVAANGKVTRKEYRFGYNEGNNKLQEVLLPDGNAQFVFNAKQNILTETLLINDTASTNKYFFDAQGRVHTLETYDYTNKLVRKILRNFASNGLIYREEVVTKIPNGSDSAIHIYTYNAQKKLVKKQVFAFRSFLVNLDGGLKPSHKASQNSIETYTYMYDKKGNKIGEEYINSLDKLSKYYASWQYDDKGLVTKRTFKIGSAEPEIYVYEYGFFE